MGKLKISTEIESASLILGEEKAIEYIAKAGFDGWDFSMHRACRHDWQNNRLILNDYFLRGQDYLSFARRLKRVADDNGIVCNQSHAPAPTNFPEVRDLCLRSIECTAEAGGKICVIHPDSTISPEKNAEFFHELLPLAKQCGVKIATENMFTWAIEGDRILHATKIACSDPERFLTQLNLVNDDFLVACLDIGHAELNGLETSAVEMIRALGPKLQALHIHDNDKLRDRHQIPFSMSIDFDAVMKTLKECGYNGYLTLESDRFLVGRTEETAFEGIQALAAAAGRLSDLYDRF